VPHGSLNDTSTTCGTTRKLTCNPCYNMVGNGLAVCESDATWTFDSECVIKGKIYIALSKTLNQHITLHIYKYFCYLIFYLKILSVLLNTYA